MRDGSPSMAATWHAAIHSLLKRWCVPRPMAMAIFDDGLAMAWVSRHERRWISQFKYIAIVMSLRQAVGQNLKTQKQWNDVQPSISIIMPSTWNEDAWNQDGQKPQRSKMMKINQRHHKCSYFSMTYFESVDFDGIVIIASVAHRRVMTSDPKVK